MYTTHMQYTRPHTTPCNHPNATPSAHTPPHVTTPTPPHVPCGSHSPARSPRAPLAHRVRASRAEDGAGMAAPLPLLSLRPPLGVGRSRRAAFRVAAPVVPASPAGRVSRGAGLPRVTPAILPAVEAAPRHPHPRGLGGETVASLSLPSGCGVPPRRNSRRHRRGTLPPPARGGRHATFRGGCGVCTRHESRPFF